MKENHATWRLVKIATVQGKKYLGDGHNNKCTKYREKLWWWNELLIIVLNFDSMQIQSMRKETI